MAFCYYSSITCYYVNLAHRVGRDWKGTECIKKKTARSFKTGAVSSVERRFANALPMQQLPLRTVP